MMQPQHPPSIAMPHTLQYSQNNMMMQQQVPTSMQQPPPVHNPNSNTAVFQPPPGMPPLAVPNFPPPSHNFAPTTPPPSAIIPHPLPPPSVLAPSMPAQMIPTPQHYQQQQDEQKARRAICHNFFNTCPIGSIPKPMDGACKGASKGMLYISKRAIKHDRNRT